MVNSHVSRKSIKMAPLTPIQQMVCVGMYIRTALQTSALPALGHSLAVSSPAASGSLRLAAGTLAPVLGLRCLVAAAAGGVGTAGSLDFSSFSDTTRCVGCKQMAKSV